MYLLYVDESGDPSKPHYIMAGIAVFERQEYWFASQVQSIQNKHFPHATEQVFFHLRDIVKGEEPWNRVDKSKKEQIIGEMYDVLTHCRPPSPAATPPNGVLFGVALETKHYLYSDIIAITFEKLCYLFDNFLKERYKQRDRQRGLVVLSKPHFEQKFAELLAGYRKRIPPWAPRRVVNLIDVPLFTASRASRMLQLADFVAGAIYQNYVHADSANMTKILPGFSTSGTPVSYPYLLHVTDDPACSCPATHSF